MKLREMTEWTDIDEAAFQLGVAIGLWSEEDDVFRTKIRETVNQKGSFENVACYLFYLLDEMCSHGFLERDDLDREWDDERLPKMRWKGLKREWE